MTTGKIPFQFGPNALEAARQIFIERLKRDQNWKQLDSSGDGFAPYADYAATNDVARNEARRALVSLTHEVFWQLLVEGIVAPGFNSSNLNLPHFHVTQYGEQVLRSNEPQPHDPTGYLSQLRGNVPNADPTVLAYLTEALETFRKGNVVASTVMLGIAAERVFLLLCDSLHNALADVGEKAVFDKLLSRFPMKPKVDWVQNKIQPLQARAGSGIPENASIMLLSIYDMMRSQRNELGHPRETPPKVARQDAFVSLQVFSRYYQIAEEVRAYLSSNSV